MRVLETRLSVIFLAVSTEAISSNFCPFISHHSFFFISDLIRQLKEILISQLTLKRLANSQFSIALIKLRCSSIPQRLFDLLSNQTVLVEFSATDFTPHVLLKFE